MNIEERINILDKLKNYLLSTDENWINVKQEAQYANAWFIPEFIELSIQNICTAFLDKKKLESWVQAYSIANNFNKKTVGVVMAGNIPLVGFHDFLCVFMSGHKILIKPSSKDEVLIKHIVEKLIEWDERLTPQINFAQTLKNCDAYIATGSNNSSRYFDLYFGKYPNIIRRNRTSVAVINGNETQEELKNLAKDIQLYFGQGCRNVTHLYVPENYDFIPLLQELKTYEYFLDFHKYKHNYDYQLAMLMMNSKFYMTDGSVILSQNDSIFSAISQVHYSYYKNIEDVKTLIENNDDIQCVVGKNYTPFGTAQIPSLTDYADGIDTMKFLAEL
ncbi:MAG: acyl-CoA reductase [Chitinophagaceae bacterium]|nr:acyl-CoA reductase [Chitinophagaceae bacterium]